MPLVCDLEVDVNGQQVFFVNKKILCSFSGRLSKLFEKLPTPIANCPTQSHKVIFHDFPFESQAFELVSRFCYDNGRIQINHSNICLLHCAAHFMEMSSKTSNFPNLIEQTEKFLRGIGFWTWSETLTSLKQCQHSFSVSNSSGILQKLLDSLIMKISSTSDASPSNSSPESSNFRSSCDTRSTESTKNSYRPWWFEDLSIFSCNIIGKLIKTMIFRKFNHTIISRFLICYLKLRFSTAKSSVRLEIVETTVDLLCLLHQSSVSCKSLFGILRVASGLGLSKSCRSRLENMIGLQLDQASLDNLLIPGPAGTDCLYDVNLVLRLVRSFLSTNRGSTALKMAGRLIDKYITEVAPDSGLKSAKFISLARALPDSARDSYDEIYRATDIYLEVHAGLSEEEKIKICYVLNYEKLSSETFKHLAQNSKIPSRTAVQPLITQQSKLKSLLQDSDHLSSLGDSMPAMIGEINGKNEENGEQIILYAKSLDLSMENEKLRANLQGMQWRVVELEKICRKMQTQMAKIMKNRLSGRGDGGGKSLPKLCS